MVEKKNTTIEGTSSEKKREATTHDESIVYIYIYIYIRTDTDRTYAWKREEWTKNEHELVAGEGVESERERKRNGRNGWKREGRRSILV